MFAAVGSIQSMAGIIGTVVYNSLYPVTLSFWPGFCFATGFFLSFIPLSMMGYVFIYVVFIFLQITTLLYKNQISSNLRRCNEDCKLLEM